MATYKIPQDVEAEDHLLGPLTMRQFIYAIIVVLSGWLTVVVAQNIATMILLPVTLLPFLFFSFLIFLGIKNRSQPAESYLAAIVRFYFKPHKRIWSQDGVMETVKITVPKKEEHNYTDGLSRYEVKSRLNNLSNLMDSHGWSAKDVRYQPTLVTPQSNYEDDRLMSLSQITQTLDPVDVHDSDDIMDNYSNPVAQQFDSMIQAKQEEVLSDALKHMKDPNYNPYPTMHQQVIQPATSQQSSVASQKSIDANQMNSTTSPQTAVVSQQTQADDDQQPITRRQGTGDEGQTAPSPAIIDLAHNDEFSVQTIANQADRLKSLESGDEISLH